MKKHILQLTLAIAFSIILTIGICSPIPAQTQTQQILFTDNFEKGLAVPWDWETGWTVDRIDGNYVLHGAGHIFARLMPDAAAGEIESFESRINLLKGSLHINYRTSMSGGRYFVRVENGGLSLLKSIRKQPAPTEGDIFNHFELSRKSSLIPYGVWHKLQITSTGNRIQVYLDDKIQIDYTDGQDPYTSGSIAFESLDDGEVLIDDVVLKGQPLETPPPGLSWIFTGGPRGGIGYDIRFNPLDQNNIWVTDAFAGTHQSTDGGKTWKARNDGIDSRSGMSGDAIPVFSLTIDPIDPEIIWAGVMGTRGLFKSTNGGQSWVRKDNGIKDEPNMEMRGITVDPFDTNTVYCGGNYLVDEAKLKQRGFIYKTKDGGENWELLIEPDALVRWIIVDPTDRNIIYASTGIFDRFAVKPTGVLKSTDGGQTWNQINKGFNNLVVAALAMHPKDHLTLIAGTGKAPSFADEPQEINGGIFITYDGGNNWQQVDPIKATGDVSIRFSAVAFAPSDPNIVYADAGNDFLRSEDGGKTWTDYYVGPNLANGMLENRGQPIAISVLPSDPDTIFMNAYDGGVFLSTNGGKTWQDSSQGYSGAQVWGIALDPKNPAFVVAVSKNGVHVSYDAGNTWHGRISEGWINNLSVVAINRENRDNILIGRAITGDISQSIDGGFTWKDVLGPLGEDTLYGRRAIHEIAYAPSTSKIVYAATGIETLSSLGVTRNTPGPGIFKSIDGGQTWSPINNGLESTTMSIMSVAIHPQNPDIVYLGEMNNGIFKSVDGGGHWTPVNNELLQKDIRALAIDPKNPETIYAGAEFGGIWKSNDGGDSWKNISSGLSPEASVRSIAIDPAQTNILYAADMQTGVYQTTDSGASWKQIKQGLAVRAIHGLAISDDGRTVYAATEGNGVYRMDLGGQPPLPVSEITLDEFLGLTNSPITVDGVKSDWDGRKIILTDPAGDVENGFLDFTNGYAFHDEKALYFLAETVDPKGSFVQFDILFEADGRKYVCSVKPGDSVGSIGDITVGYQAVGQTKFSQFAFGTAFEGRIDLRDLGSPKYIRLISINALTGVCCENPLWHATDSLEFQGPTLSETESLTRPISEPVTVENSLPIKVEDQLPAGQQEPAKVTVSPLLPVLGGLVIIILAGFLWSKKKVNGRKNGS